MHYEWLSFVIKQSDGVNFAKQSFSATFLCQRVSSNYFLPGAVEYKASSPQAQQAKCFLNPQPVCTGPSPCILNHTRRRWLKGHFCWCMVRGSSFRACEVNHLQVLVIYFLKDKLHVTHLSKCNSPLIEGSLKETKHNSQHKSRALTVFMLIV